MDAILDLVEKDIESGGSSSGDELYPSYTRSGGAGAGPSGGVVNKGAVAMVNKRTTNENSNKKDAWSPPDAAAAGAGPSKAAQGQKRSPKVAPAPRVVGETYDPFAQGAGGAPFNNVRGEPRLGGQPHSQQQQQQQQQQPRGSSSVSPSPQPYGGVAGQPRGDSTSRPQPQTTPQWHEEDYRTPVTDRRRNHPFLEMQSSSSALLELARAVATPDPDNGGRDGRDGRSGGSTGAYHHSNQTPASSSAGGDTRTAISTTPVVPVDESPHLPGSVPHWERPALGSPLVPGVGPGTPTRSSQKYLSPRLDPIRGRVANGGGSNTSNAVNNSKRRLVLEQAAQRQAAAAAAAAGATAAAQGTKAPIPLQQHGHGHGHGVGGGGVGGGVRRDDVISQPPPPRPNPHATPKAPKFQTENRPRPISTSGHTRRGIDDEEMRLRSELKKARLQARVAEMTGTDVEGTPTGLITAPGDAGTPSGAGVLGGAHHDGGGGGSGVSTRNVAAIARWRQVLPATNALEDMRRSIAAFAEISNDAGLKARTHTVTAGLGAELGKSKLASNATPTRSDGKLRSQMRSLERRMHDVRLWMHRRRWRTVDFFLFRSSLRKIEARSGTGVVSVFVFMRLIVVLNFISILTWAALCIVPLIVKGGLGHGFEDGVEFPRVLGGGGLEGTWAFFGGYPRELDGYRFDVAYFAAIALQYGIVFAALFRKMARKIREKYDRASLVRRDRFYPFSSLIFSSWDHTITSKDAAANLSRGIATSVQETLSDFHEQVAPPATTKELVLRYAGRALGILLTLSLTVVVFLAVSLIIVNEETLASSTTVYIVPLAVSVCNVAFPFVVKYIVKLEGYSPGTAVRQTIARTFALKLLTLLALVVRIYAQVTGDGAIPLLGSTLPSSMTDGTSTGSTSSSTSSSSVNPGGASVGLDGMGVENCAEAVIGIQITRLVVADALVTILSLLVWGTLGRCTDPNLQWDIPTSCLDAVYRAALHSLGSVFAPALPVLALVSNVLIFYFSKAIALWACAPPIRPWGASRTSTFFLFFLTLGMVVSLVPVVVFIRVMVPKCGPFGGVSGWDAVAAAIREAPPLFVGFFTTVTSPIALLTVIAVLASTLYFVKASLVKKKLLLDEAMTELEREHSEKITLIRDLKASFARGSPIR